MPEAVRHQPGTASGRYRPDSDTDQVQAGTNELIKTEFVHVRQIPAYLSKLA